MNSTETKINILLPTRGRPEEFNRMRKSALDTADNPEAIRFVVYMDKDDQSPYKFDIENRGRLEVIFGERVVLSEMWNKCYELANSDILMHAGDDIVFKTKGWDTMVINAFNNFEDHILFVHGDDGYWGSTFGTHGFIHRNWVKTVGYFVPPFYVSDFNDTHLNELANYVGRRVYLPFVTEHMHFLFGKGPKDQTHIDRILRHNKEKPQDIYHSKEMEVSRQNDARKLFNFINNFKK